MSLKYKSKTQKLMEYAIKSQVIFVIRIRQFSL